MEFGYSMERKVFDYVNKQCLENPKSDGVWQVEFHTRYCYLIKNKNTGFFKIGKTRDLRTRISQLQTQTGCQIEFICACAIETFDTDERVVEEELHKVFVKKRVTGEWFRLSWLDVCRIKFVFQNLYVDNTIYPEMFFETKKRFSNA